MSAPDYKIYSNAGHYMGSARYQEDAANWASFLGAGATIRWRREVLYTIPEDKEAIDFTFYDTLLDKVRNEVRNEAEKSS